MDEQRDNKRRRRRDDDDDDDDHHLFFPQDVIYEILLKLPVKSLMKFKWVSKYFFNQISNHSFVYKHLHLSTSSQLNNNLLLLSTYHASDDNGCQCLYSCRLSEKNPLHPQVFSMHCPFDPIEYPYLDDLNKRYYSPACLKASCNGLLYIFYYRGNYDTSYIWNPCTKEYRQILISSILYPRDSSSRICLLTKFCGFCYDHINHEYKILYYKLYVDYDRPGYIAEFKLYTLETDNWRSVSTVNNDVDSSKLSFGLWTEIGLFVNGALHWIMQSKEDLKVQIISFNIEKEEFRDIYEPKLGKVSTFDLQLLQGCLCMCECDSGSGNQDIHIWMLKDYAVKDSWTKIFTLVGSNAISCSKYIKLLGYCENDEILMVMNQGNLALYDTENRSARSVEIVYDTENRRAIRVSNQTTYVESLVSLNTGLFKG